MCSFLYMFFKLLEKNIIPMTLLLLFKGNVIEDFIPSSISILLVHCKIKCNR
jgi:hypothetical protein